MSRRRFVVALHELDQVYGGPQEGGWYYDAGKPASESAHRRFTRVFRSEAKARRYLDRLRPVAAAASKGARPVWSAAYSGGQYGAILQRGEQPRPWPHRVPRWE